MLYQIYEFNNLMLTPANIFANIAHRTLSHPLSPSHYSEQGRTIAANWGMLERMTRRFTKPEFNIQSITLSDGTKVKINQSTVERRNFCKLLNFQRDEASLTKGVPSSSSLPKVLIVAPMSGHFATLLRDTVFALLQDHNVYITDWNNAREVPLILGKFDLQDYIDYIIDYIHLLGPDLNLVAVCQPAVPVMAATAILSSRKDPMAPKSVTLMGGPIDTRINPTKVNLQAKEKPIEWFAEHITETVPWYYPGAFRQVCPGFIMLSGFMSMNLERHYDAHMSFYNHLLQGDNSSAETHRKFYDEFMAVMDLPAEYYLESVNTVFQRHALPKGTMLFHGEKVDLKAIEKTALLTIEGERDDISGVGQTKAAQNLCMNIPASKKLHYEQKGVGHYGIFNGRRWREKIMPRIRDFIAKN